MKEHNRNYLLLLVSVIFSTIAFSQHSASPTNQEVISRIFATPFLKILSDSLNINGPISIESRQKELFANWTAQILTDSCLRRKILVYSPPDSSEGSADYSIVISDPRVEITYQSAGRRWLLFRKGLNRWVEGGYHLQITDREHRVLVSRYIVGSEQDIVPNDAIDAIENDTLPFTRGTKLDSPFIKRWLEPLIITATTMTVVYLFYSLRSKK